MGTPGAAVIGSDLMLRGDCRIQALFTDGCVVLVPVFGVSPSNRTTNTPGYKKLKACIEWRLDTSLL